LIEPEDDGGGDADGAAIVGLKTAADQLSVDKPNEFVRTGWAFVVRFCISRKHL
jgi:hypothetical protein